MALVEQFPHGPAGSVLCCENQFHKNSNIIQGDGGGSVQPSTPESSEKDPLCEALGRDLAPCPVQTEDHKSRPVFAPVLHASSSSQSPQRTIVADFKQTESTFSDSPLLSGLLWPESEISPVGSCTRVWYWKALGK